MDRLKSTTLRLTGRCITFVEKPLEAIVSTTFKSHGQKEHESRIQLFTPTFGFGKIIIDLLATDKSRYLVQPRPIIVNYVQIKDHSCFISYASEMKMNSNLL